MTVVDTNPMDKSSRAFEKGLEEMERKSDKKIGTITIKTMRRGKVRRVSEERFETDNAGRIKVMDKRLIRYNEFSYPVQEHIPIGDQKMMTYKYPSQDP